MERSKDLDLSGFPVIRLDQIPLVDTPTLSRAIEEVNELISNMIHDVPTPPLLGYLRKQRDSMKQQITDRTAEERINMLLTGAKSLMTSEQSHITSTAYDDKIESKTEVKPIYPSFPPVNSSFKPIPLPSQIRVEKETVKPPMSESRRYHQPNPIPESLQTESISTTRKAQETEKPTETIPEPTAKDPNLQQLTFTDSRDSGDEQSTHSVSTRTSRASSRQEEKKNRTGISHRRPTRRADVVNQGFSTSFIVAATEKKKRYFPPKKEVLSEEEIKAKDKQERRNAAMQRLLKRQEERQKAITEQREKAKKAREAVKKQKSFDASNDGDSSSSESISGGDEPEKGVKLDPSLVQGVEAAILNKEKYGEVAEQKSDQIVNNIVKNNENMINNKRSMQSINKGKKDYKDLIKGKNHDKLVENTLKNEKIPKRRKSLNGVEPEVIKHKRGDNKGVKQVSDERKLTRSADGIRETSGKEEVQLTEEVQQKSNAALSILRGLKMKKKQMKLSSFKDGLEPANDETPHQSMTQNTIVAEKTVTMPQSEPLPIPIEKEQNSIEQDFSENVIPTAAVEDSVSEKVSSTDTDSPNEESETVVTESFPNTKNKNEDPGKSITSPVDERCLETEDQAIEKPNFMNITNNATENLKKQEVPPIISPQESVESVKIPFSTPPLDLTPSDSAAPELKEHKESSESSVEKEADASDGYDDDDDPVAIGDFIRESLRASCAGSQILRCSGIGERSVENSQENAREVYFSRYSPDDLPGLAAWKLRILEQEENNASKNSLSSSSRHDFRWEVEIKVYKNLLVNSSQNWKIDTTGDINDSPTTKATKERLFRQRSQLTKYVSRGLLVLLLDFEDLLLGSVEVEGEEEFISWWEECLRQFDENAASIAEEDSDVLFDQVEVCGNCHAVCKKIENLLTTHFAKMKNMHSKGRRHLHLQLQTSEEITSLIKRVQSSKSVTFQVEDEGNVSSGDADKKKKETENDQPSSVAVNKEVVDNVKSDDDDDDDDFIIPQYSHSKIPEKEKRSETAEIMPEIIEPLKNNYRKTEPEAEDINKNEILKSNSTKTPSTLSASESKADKPSKSEETRLKDFFPTFEHIFPIIYRPMDSKQVVEGDRARQLVEAMQHLSSVYDEWIEVMSDYSTVFSDQRGVNEFHYDSNGSRIPEDRKKESSQCATVYKGGTRSLHYRVKSSRTEVYNIVTDIFNNNLPQWEELPSGLGLGLSWNILWTWSKPRINMAHILVWQKVNHFLDSKQLTRKDLLKKNIQRYTNMSGKAAVEFEIMPLTFILPHEYTAFVSAFTKLETMKGYENKQNFWIMKPVGLSRGRGISLVKDLSQITYSQSTVVQQYVENPLCLNGYKFDLRLYVLVTSFKPLEAFIYQEGFARVSTQQYSIDPTEMVNKFIHLTNSSIQKHNTQNYSKDNPLHSAEGNNDTGGSKISLLGGNGLWKRLEDNHIDTKDLWENICGLVVKSLVMTDDKMTHQPCCFELYGYDVLIDSDLRPWLIEVNASPSLARDNHLDHRVKNELIKDIIQLIDPAPFDRAAVSRIIKKRIQYILKNKFTLSTNDPELEKDLKEILGDFIPRKYGEMPRNMGKFEMITPGTKVFSDVLKLKKRIIKS